MLAAATLMAALPVAELSAQEAPQLREQRVERLTQREGMSDSVRRAERDGRGEVLSAERVQYDGRDMHRVKVVDDQGRVRVYMQDPARQNNAGRQASRKEGD